MDAFKVEIIAVCQNSKELSATEKFWTLYYNRKNNRNGFDLNLNEMYNPIIGDLMEEASERIPKYLLTKDILNGLEVKEIMEKYQIKTYETLDNLFEKYYDVRSLWEIRSLLIRPVLERSLKMGLDRDQALQMFIESEIFFIERYNWQYVLINKYTKLIWQKTYSQLFLEFFITPYVAYLRDIGIEVVEKEVKDSIGLIELLVLEGLGETEISYQVGLCGRNDPKYVIDSSRKKVRRYIRNRWKMSISELYDFLNTNFLKPDERDAYILNL